MPNVFCESCGEETRWRNYSGARLKDFPCPSCGGRLRPRGYSKTPQVRIKQGEYDQAILELLKTPMVAADILEQIRKIPKFERVHYWTVCRHLDELVDVGRIEERWSKEKHTPEFKVKGEASS